MLSIDFIIILLLHSSSSSNTKVSEGSTLQLECGVQLSEEYDPHLTSIQWYWNAVPIYNNSKGCGKDCSGDNQSPQSFLITETIRKSYNVMLLLRHCPSFKFCVVLGEGVATGTVIRPIFQFRFLCLFSQKQRRNRSKIV